jgi:hypothetical protein
MTSIGAFLIPEKTRKILDFRKALMDYFLICFNLKYPKIRQSKNPDEGKDFHQKVFTILRSSNMNR